MNNKSVSCVFHKHFLLCFQDDKQVFSQNFKDYLMKLPFLWVLITSYVKIDFRK